MLPIVETQISCHREETVSACLRGIHHGIQAKMKQWHSRPSPPGFSHIIIKMKLYFCLSCGDGERGTAVVIAGTHASSTEHLLPYRAESFPGFQGETR